MKDARLLVADVARFCTCHGNTVRYYEKRGIISSVRDINNFRRFTQVEAEKLRQLLSARWPEPNKDEKP